MNFSILLSEKFIRYIFGVLYDFDIFVAAVDRKHRKELLYYSQI